MKQLSSSSIDTAKSACSLLFSISAADLHGLFMHVIHKQWLDFLLLENGLKVYTPNNLLLTEITEHRAMT